jgi:hypothetical protein
LVNIVYVGLVYINTPSDPTELNGGINGHSASNKRVEDYIPSKRKKLDKTIRNFEGKGSGANLPLSVRRNSPYPCRHPIVKLPLRNLARLSVFRRIIGRLILAFLLENENILVKIAKGDVGRIRERTGKKQCPARSVMRPYLLVNDTPFVKKVALFRHVEDNTSMRGMTLIYALCLHICPRISDVNANPPSRPQNSSALRQNIQ